MTVHLKGRDPNINILDGIHKIKNKSTVNVIVSNYTNKHLTFHKGEYIGHLESHRTKTSTDRRRNTPRLNSVTLKKDDCLKQLHLTPSIHHAIMTSHQLYKDNLKLLLEEYDSQFAQDETSIGMTPLTSMSIDTGTADPVSQKPYPIAMKHYDWVKRCRLQKLLTAKSNTDSSHSSWLAPIIVIPKGDGGKHLVSRLQGSQQGYQEVYLAYAQSGQDIFSKLTGATYFTTLDL